jgi:hypothetical protein
MDRRGPAALATVPRAALRAFELCDHFERGPVQYALETAWLAGVGGFETLHFESDPLISVIA